MEELMIYHPLTGVVKDKLTKNVVANTSNVDIHVMRNILLVLLNIVCGTTDDDILDVIDAYDNSTLGGEDLLIQFKYTENGGYYTYKLQVKNSVIIETEINHIGGQTNTLEYSRNTGFKEHLLSSYKIEVVDLVLLSVDREVFILQLLEWIIPLLRSKGDEELTAFIQMFAINSECFIDLGKDENDIIFTVNGSEYLSANDIDDRFLTLLMLAYHNVCLLHNEPMLTVYFFNSEMSNGEIAKQFDIINELERSHKSLFFQEEF